MLSQFFGNKAFDWITSLLINKKEKHFILDPLTCVIRISILTFKPPGTKISISDNQITYHEPNIIQGPLRWSNGDNREDLHNLYYPIVKSTQWYPRTNDLKFIFRYCISGLENLKNSYNKNSTISHSLTHYIQILEKYLSEDKVSKQQEVNSNINEQTKQIYQELKNLWSPKELSLVKNLIEEINVNFEKNNESETKHYITSLENILLMKELKVNTILRNSYSILD